MENGEKVWVKFKYERLSNICFWCGHLNNSYENCELWIDSKGTLTSEQQQFDSTLKVAPYTSAGKDVIYVPGYYERKKTRVHDTAQVTNSQPGAAKGQAGSGGPVEVTQSPLVTSRSCDEGIDYMPQEDFNVAEALHADLEVEPNLDSFPITLHPIKAPINAPNIMEEGNGAMNSIPNQNLISELFEIPIKRLNEGVTGID